MAMSVQTHKTSHSWPTRHLRAPLHDRQRPQCPPYSPTSDYSDDDDDYPVRSASSLSCYSIPERSQKHNLKVEAASQLRSFSACSGRILRPPPQLHQRRFLSDEQIPRVGPAFTPTSHPCSDEDTESTPKSTPTSQEDYFMTPTPQRQSTDIAFESDTELDKRNTFGPLEPLPTCSSRWSESGYSEAGTLTQDEGELTDSESSHDEVSDVEDSLSHFSIIQARRVSFHTWVLKPMTTETMPTSQQKFFGWKKESMAGPPCSKEAKRWGIIF